MAGNSNNGSISNSEWVLLTTVIFFLLFFLFVLWGVGSSVLGQIYRIIRFLQSAGLWYFTEWGHYFFNVPRGNAYAFASIFKSSIPFGLISAGIVGVIGVLAYRKHGREHLDAKITHQNPIGYKELMELQSHDFPSNRFFLKFPQSEYPVDKGPARMPATALEVLKNANAIEGIFEEDFSNPDAAEDAPRGWIINGKRLTSYLISGFGEPNPFCARNFPFNNAERVEEAVNALPWHKVSLVYACVKRIYCAGVSDEKQFEKDMDKVDVYLKDIWRELNRCKDKLGDCLILGFIDPDHKALIEAAVHEKKPGAKVYALSDYLDETEDKSGYPFANYRKSHADLFKTTEQARKELIEILTEFRIVDANAPIKLFRDTKGNPKKLKDLSRLETEQYKAFLKKHKATVANIEELLRRNGYLFGTIATVLEQTRRVGILPPPVFRWLRYYDYPLWSFLRCIGMNTVVPEAAGMFDHYMVENKLERPLSRPYVNSAISAMKEEADKYLTPDVSRQYARQIQQARLKATSDTARQKILSSEKILRQMATSVATELVELSNAIDRQSDINPDQIIKVTYNDGKE